ncbi:hypothetical protein BT63DRAFT_227961 [Microthyrium microscopicum]|uniref:RING-type domain-containing protein n=1 Tax=Microthyrium microscopicum TaxID=703497 RepID=A0A6A6UCY6_9PEZI|nr:hypothetical protein BT63DRAFT_227961 [Microthyrium microscopicum]
MPPLQDQFIDDDDEEEFCPLCVEELDLTDKNFKPCPCGYQICQFCYNNIKTTMNGLCPACRRPYDEKNIQYKAVSAEEMAQHRQTVAQQAKKKQAAKQKEAQKREADNLSRKHLSGLRVRQKNLVYVTGLKPKATGEKLVEGLRGKEFFGQYGDIVKIVVSKSKDAHVGHNQPIAIYVTFVKKEDAANCIATIDNHKQADGSRLRAQYGTTKYCSAYLRGDVCSNKNCMFLHEPGEDNESYTREGLSNLNAKFTQEPAPLASQSPAPQPPLQHVAAMAAATQDHEVYAMTSPVDNDIPALATTSNWAEQARRASRTTTGSASSPLVTNSVVSTTENQDGKSVAKESDEAEPTAATSKSNKKSRRVKLPYFDDLPRKAFNPNLAFNYVHPANYTEKDRWIVENMPPLFDPHEGTRRRLIKEREAEEMRQANALVQAQSETREPSMEIDDTPDQGPGSSQLGGEPEDLDRGFTQHNLLQQQAIGSNALGLGQPFGLGDELSGLGSARGLAPQPNPQQQAILDQLNKVGGQSNSSQNGGHGRHPSRYFLAEGIAIATKNYAKQNGANMLGQTHFTGNAVHGQGFSGQYPYTSVQGPPPGLKTTGTPPVTGTGMFGQGHGFTPDGGYGRENMKTWDMQRGARSNGAGLDAGKRELMNFPHHQYPSTSAAAPAQGALSFPYGSHAGAQYQDSGNSQKQKKKGKKHRHANTSSSGGGVVDVADPSILQMRVGGSMAGQGGYGGQTQSGFSSSMQAAGNPYPRW